MRATAAALFLALALPVHGSLAPWSKAPVNNLFGLVSSKTLSSTSLENENPLLTARGGATKPAPEDEAAEEEEAKELYLPGLLETAIVRSDMVRNSASDLFA